MAKRQVGIFYIDANKAYFYGSNAPSILQMDLPADMMSYGDIINKDKFYQLIQAHLINNKIQPVPLLILFSPYGTYEKDVLGKTTDEINADVEQFLDAVPYERVLSKTYKVQDKTQVVAVNRDVYEAVKHSFEKLKFSTVAVVALSLLQRVMPDVGTNLNLEVIAGKFDSIKQYSFITPEEMSNPGKANQEEINTEKPNPLRLYLMIGVLVILFGVLIVMVITSLQPAPKPVINQANQLPQHSTQVTTSVPTVVPTATKKDITIPTTIPTVTIVPITPQVTP